VTPETGEEPISVARLHAAHSAVSRVLLSHQEARSMLSEARHRRILAEQSAAAAGSAAAAAAASRLRYEELRHLVDPRAERPVSCWTALALLAAPSAGLACLTWLELAVLPGREVTAAAVTAAWLAGAWLAATRPEEHTGRVTAVWAAAAFAALLAALHTLAEPDWSGFLAGMLWASLSGAIAVTAAVLISRTEPAGLARARRRWRQADARHAAAARTALADAERAAITRQSWLGLVGSVIVAQGDDQLTRDATGVAADMI
jgi:hypothetical protein